MQHLMQTYARLPLSFSHGNGVWLHSTDGGQYLDCVTGVAVCGLGHAHPRLAKAISDQAQKLLHCSNLFQIPEQQALGDTLCELSGMDRVFFCNSGAEANEAAIKLARLHGRRLGHASPKTIVMEGSFHGRTMATLSATGNKKVQDGFAPLVEGFIHVPYNDIDAIETTASQHDDIVAILVEPVQGEGGIRVPSDDYLPRIRQLCDQHGWLMMLDEVQTGVGRTGEWFAFQHSGATPDVMSLAKGLGSGIPIGACLARGAAADLFAPGNHGSTFGGNPLACVASSTVIDTLRENDLVANAKRQGQRLLDGFNASIGDLHGVTAIRGKGLLFGIELAKPCGDLVKAAMEKNILINVTSGNVIRLVPALILKDDETDLIIQKVSQLVIDFLQSKD